MQAKSGSCMDRFWNDFTVLQDKLDIVSKGGS